MKLYILTGICVICVVTLLLTKYVKHRSGFDKVVRIAVTFSLIQSLFSVIIIKVLPSEFEILDFISPFVFTYGPLLFLALQYYEKSEQEIRKSLIWHGLPFYMAFLLFIATFFALLFSMRVGKEFFLIWYLALGVSFFVYSIVIALQVYKKAIPRKLFVFSTIAVFIFVIGDLAIGITAFRILKEGVSALSSYSLLFHLLTFSYLLLWYFRQIIRSRKNIFSKESFSFNSNILNYILPEESEESDKVNTDKTEMVEDRAASLEEEILERLDYLNPDLTVSLQAELLDMSATELSSIIKEKTGMSYNAFINKKRVEFAVQRISKGYHVDLDDLIQLSGFNSTASFYRNFKKYTGQTPSKFISKYKNTAK